MSSTINKQKIATQSESLFPFRLLISSSIVSCGLAHQCFGPGIFADGPVSC